MFQRGTGRSGVAVLIFGIALLGGPLVTHAQRGGGGGGAGPSAKPVICLHDCKTLQGLNAEDDLKNFRRAIAVQATPEQRAAFAKVAQYSQAAIESLQAFRESLQKVAASSPLSDRAAILDQAIAQARASNQNFLASFSSKQKSALQDTVKKLEKADSDLDKQIKALDQIVQTLKPESEQISNSAASLDKALASFQSEQLALGGEMSILFPAPGQDVTFSLPPVTNSISIGGQPISIPASGGVSRVVPETSVPKTSAENDHNLFNVKIVADLSDLQQNITGILRSELTRSPRCGERIEVRQATLTPLEPASLVVANLHFERWVCQPGQQSPMEVADGDGTIEVKLALSLEPKDRLGSHLRNYPRPSRGFPPRLAPLW